MDVTESRRNQETEAKNLERVASEPKNALKDTVPTIGQKRQVDEDVSRRLATLVEEACRR